ncbi:hypothetical protein [Nocardioides nanhaiensis]|uniref:WXG100 family type VII secretion target n=1 Tax=Nocardioides nanhaiensis TaxID=1476871 RepID=A0ABP8VYM2_9ACTN
MGEVLQSDLDALAADAATWDDTSTALNQASLDALFLTLTVSDMSWAAEVTGLLDTYSDFRTHVSGLLGEGATNTGEIAEGLRAVKRSYESTDASVRDDYVGLWDAK